MTQANYVSPSAEDWQDFVDWDGDEIFDPIFQRDAGLHEDNLVSQYHLSESVGSEQPYLVSAPPSLEYTISAPPSIIGESSSFGQVYCTSPSFSNTTTSPTGGFGDSRYFGSFDACDNALSPLEYPRESPILDTRYDRIPDRVPSSGSFDSPTETVFNPYVAGSSHSFSGLDVRASQMLNVGTWMDQPQIIEPIAEADEYNTDAAPIAIPYPQSQSFNNSLISDSWSVDQHFRSRAVSIPQSSHRPMSYNAAQRVPPALSVSPVSYRRPRSLTLSRSNSRNGSRRGVASPSPTSDGLGWVAYQMNSQTNRLAPTSMEGAHGRTPRGRKKGLTSEQRTHAALMRIVGACDNCKARKERCDPGTPCKSCVDHYKGDLVNHPCRNRVLSDQASAFLSESLGWHPTARPIESFLSATSFAITSDITYKIPLCFGFGLPLAVPVHAVHIDANQPHIHNHFIYSWPPESSKVSEHTHAVLPAVLTRHVMSNLMQTLDHHLSLLVTHHFRHFPLYCSPLKILRDVYIFFRSLPSNSSHSRVLRQALKLLVLVHVGGDITLPPPNTNPALSRLVQDTMAAFDESEPTPCFIRSQFGSVMPGLALSLMKEVLSSLEQLLLNRDCEDWPMALALLITVLMTIESIHYHAAKLPYHNSFDTPRSSVSIDDLNVDDEGVTALLAFYTACFSGCQARLRPDWEGEASRPQKTSRPEDIFVESVRECVKNANGVGYLSRKATEKRQGDDMEYFFDRLVARLLLLKP
jgi:hypothetical protein